MSQIKAELILASQNGKTGDIIYTFKLTFPHIILAEVNTHTIAVKNTASSRAIPTKKQLKAVFSDPFIPTSIGFHKPGMQSGAEIVGWRRWVLERLWSVSRYAMLATSFLSWRLGAAKQFSNRLVEPWMMVEQIWTATDVKNEMLLRDHPDAEPHYHELARQKNRIVDIVERYFAGYAYPGDRYPDPLEVREVTDKCQTLSLGEWHLPFTRKAKLVGEPDDREAIRLSRIFDITGTNVQFRNNGNFYLFPISEVDQGKDNALEITILKALACARCAWVSYESPTAEKLNNITSALLTYNKLTLSNPKHLSPTQHVATPLPTSVRVGNLCGWFQHRKELVGESGGDKVVVSITPDMAIKLLKDPVAPLSIMVNNY